MYESTKASWWWTETEKARKKKHERLTRKRPGTGCLTVYRPVGRSRSGCGDWFFVAKRIAPGASSLTGRDEGKQRTSQRSTWKKSANNRAHGNHVVWRSSHAAVFKPAEINARVDRYRTLRWSAPPRGESTASGYRLPEIAYVVFCAQRRPVRKRDESVPGGLLSSVVSRRWLARKPNESESIETPSKRALAGSRVWIETVRDTPRRLRTCFSPHTIRSGGSMDGSSSSSGAHRDSSCG